MKKEERSKQGQTNNKTKQHSTPKAVVTLHVHTSSSRGTHTHTHTHTLTLIRQAVIPNSPKYTLRCRADHPDSPSTVSTATFFLATNHSAMSRCPCEAATWSGVRPRESAILQALPHRLAQCCRRRRLPRATEVSMTEAWRGQAQSGVQSVSRS